MLKLLNRIKKYCKNKSGTVFFEGNIVYCRVIFAKNVPNCQAIMLSMAS